jgi:gamma-glutamyltranspeptidase / glutathione hydrolase
MSGRNWLVLIIILLIHSCKPSKTATGSLAGITPFQYEARKKIIAENGLVVSAHPLASQTGLAILKKGGTAIDAAIATQFALAVVYPGAGNIGGGGFTIARLSDGKQIAIDFREMAPAASTRDMYLDENGNALVNKSQRGHLASGVPGTVAGIFAFYKYASLPFKELIQPAIELAENGFMITARQAISLNDIQDDLAIYNTRESAFNKTGGWKEGDTLIQTDLANTLKRIRDQGEQGFYAGETARLLTEEMSRGKGLITLSDLAAYKARQPIPHEFHYKEFKIISMPMPSSGGILINQMMKMIEQRNLKEMGFHSPSAVQLMTEVERRAYADRGRFMGDTEFYNVPVNELVSNEYLEQRMKDYNPARANLSVQHGAIPGYETEETTHLSVFDKSGNAVAITTTLNDSYGNRVVVRGAGFFLNDQMDDFSIKAGVPNMYGAIGGLANSIMPGKRMLSSMSPTIVLKDDSPYIITGTPGGMTIPSSVFQVLVNLIEFGLDAEKSVNSPRFHHQWLPDSIFVEEDFPNAVIDRLEQIGYRIKKRSPIGRVELIVVNKNKPRIEGVADKRGDDSAEGY